MASKMDGVLYVGVTSSLAKRVWEHKEGLVEGFTEKYNVKRLVYFELHSDMSAAITREKQIKKWSRVWKIRLIEKTNPAWLDLWDAIL